MRLAVPDDEMYSCEELGLCDDSCSPPAREDCTVTVPHDAVEEAPPPTLPDTGANPLALLLIATVVVAAGVYVLARRKANGG